MSFESHMVPVTLCRADGTSAEVGVVWQRAWQLIGFVPLWTEPSNPQATDAAINHEINGKAYR